MPTIEYLVKAVDDMSATLNKIGGNVDQLNRRLDDLSKKKATPSVELADKEFVTHYDSVKARLDDLSKRVATARADVQDKDAKAKLDALAIRLDMIGRKVASPKIRIDGLDRAELQLIGLDAQLDRFGKTAKDAAGPGGVGALIGGGGAQGAGIAALIGSAVALSPLIATAAVGLTGFGAAAYGVAKPIENAAQKTGGLSKNMHLLDPEQQAVARSLLALGKDYGQFQQALKPTVLADFGDGLRLVRNLMHDVQPVSVAVGKDIGILVTGLNKAAASQEWQNFFKFMAGPGSQDVRQFDAILLKLVNDIPPLVQAMQPLTQAFLALTNTTTNFASLNLSLADNGDLLQKVGKDAITWWGDVKYAITGVLPATDKASKSLHHVAQASAETSQRITTVISPMDHLGKVADTTRITQDRWGEVLNKNNGYLETQAHNLNVVAAQYEKGLTPLENYIGAQITEANDLHQLNIALKASGDRIGYKTQKERDSFSAAQAYIADTIKEGNSALAAHQGIDQQIKSIEQALPRLEQVKGKTAAYKTELDNLKGILDALRREKLIQEQVQVTGRGTWNVQGLPGSISAHVHGAGHAAGWRVPGYGGGDKWPALLEGGESVVPKHLTPAVAPFLRLHGVPGFAEGVVGSYAGSPGGLPSWTSANQHATIVAITDAMAKSMASSFAQALGSFGPGPGGGAPAANAALARRLFPQWSTGAAWAAWNYVAMAESGWNQFARNPSSGAYGIPQALPPSKMGPAANPPMSNPAAQIRWMAAYMSSVYGGPIGAAAHEAAFHWYGSGLRGRFTRPSVIGVAERGPEDVTVTPVGRSGGRGGALVNVENLTVQNATDMELISHRLNFLLTSASL